MEVINKNIKLKNNIIDYLKSINVNSTNKHEEIDLKNYIASVVMISTNTTTLNNYSDDFCVYVIFQNKNNKNIYSDFFYQEFVSEDEARNYYNDLKNKVSLFSDDDILKFINK